ncbi:BnaA02g22050D [Brassica napus]|uniref:BnaA02g22050D protein n=2 Tax=Brassica TaxID=3705 RepID=A0A078GIN7_BRANA|nr:BnaA02g22050D [Brassica napus]VDC90126.1 unnamed protein product [Brassica rapa]
MGQEKQRPKRETEESPCAKALPAQRLHSKEKEEDKAKGQKVTQERRDDVKVPEALLPGAVAPGSDVRDANTCKVAEQATTPDGSLSGHLPAAKGQIDLEENAPKKARVD